MSNIIKLLYKHKCISLSRVKQLQYKQYIAANSIDCVMVSVLVSCAVERGFKSWSGQTKDNEIDICCLFAKHTSLRKKSKDWLP